MKSAQPAFSSSAALQHLIDQYFQYLAGEYHLEEKAGKNTEAPVAQQKVWDRQPEPPTLTGLVYHLGFNSRQAFDNYEAKGKYAGILKRGHLRIEMEYEKKLHNQSAAGAIFALKSLGWKERGESPAENELTKSLTMKIVETGPRPAGSEKEVIL
ncbi:hypothetical protein BH09BAC6_BH09BAC6_32180 [soil metagenome]|jgi:hypothetical protein